LTPSLAWRSGAALTALALCAWPVVPASAQAGAEHVHVATPGDTLIGIGDQLLAEPRRWRDVARLNRLADPDRIAVGQRLRIPVGWMRTEPRPATLLSSTGSVKAPATLDEGSEIVTGADGHAVLRLVDGTLLRLRPGSRLGLTESRVVPRTPVTRAGARLDAGRVEVEAAPAPRGQPGFRIETPQGVLGVRGTEFRVATGAPDAAAPPSTRGEVLEGRVDVAGAGGSTPVAAGFGTVVDAAGRVAAPVPLLPPPVLGGLPTLQERVLVRFTLPPLPGAVAWRAQVAADAGFERVLADLRETGDQLRIAGLPDGDYRLRVRGVDAVGLEGRDADLAFRLKARPEPPLPSSPGPGERRFGDRVEFGWAANADAGRYRLQLATDPSFAAPLRELDDLRGLGTVIEGLAPGTYHWRLRSVRPDGDPGPWGDPGSFELRPAPPAPPAPSVDGRGVRFAWEGLPGQAFDFQVARDAAFGALLFERRLSETAIELPRPASGRYWVRLRAIDPDGFVGPFGGAQFFDVPHCLRDAAGGCVRAGGDPVLTRP
jgi:hypothetical protein